VSGGCICSKVGSIHGTSTYWPLGSNINHADVLSTICRDIKISRLSRSSEYLTLHPDHVGVTGSPGIVMYGSTEVLTTARGTDAGDEVFVMR
jgi:hypothetical protein